MNPWEWEVAHLLTRQVRSRPLLLGMASHASCVQNAQIKIRLQS